MDAKNNTQNKNITDVQCLVMNFTLIMYRTQEIFGRRKIGKFEPKFSSPIFIDTPKMYLSYAVTVAYSPNFSLSIAFTCTVHQIFLPPNISRVWCIALFTY